MRCCSAAARPPPRGMSHKSLFRSKPHVQYCTYIFILFPILFDSARLLLATQVLVEIGHQRKSRNIALRDLNLNFEGTIKKQLLLPTQAIVEIGHQSKCKRVDCKRNSACKTELRAKLRSKTSKKKKSACKTELRAELRSKTSKCRPK
jgi:hypothetical protein